MFVVITVARQIMGEYIAIRTEKGFKDEEKAKAYLAEMKKKVVTPDGEPKVVKVSTPQGDLECMCEVGVFHVETEE